MENPNIMQTEFDDLIIHWRQTALAQGAGHPDAVASLAKAIAIDHQKAAHVLRHIASKRGKRLKGDTHSLSTVCRAAGIKPATVTEVLQRAGVLRAGIEALAQELAKPQAPADMFERSPAYETFNGLSQAMQDAVSRRIGELMAERESDDERSPAFEAAMQAYRDAEAAHDEATGQPVYALADIAKGLGITESEALEAIDRMNADREAAGLPAIAPVPAERVQRRQ